MTILPDDLLPGVGEAQMPHARRRCAPAARRWSLMLALITVAEQLERAAGGVLAPDIQDTLHMSDTTLIGVTRVRRRRPRARRDAARVARRPHVARADRVDRDDRMGRRDGASTGSS